MAWVVGSARPGSATGRKPAGPPAPCQQARRCRRGWTAGVALLLGLVVAGWARAQCTPEGCPAGDAPQRLAPSLDPPGELPPPAVVRVMVASGRVRSFGSGTVIRGEPAGYAVLTCAHLFRDGAEQIWVLAGGKPWNAHLLAANPTWDLAVLEVPAWSQQPGAAGNAERGAASLPVCRVEAATIAPVAPRPGQWLQSCGFGSDGRYRCNRGQVLGYARTGNTQGYETLALSGTARLGDSGGPIFDAQGQLVGVVWGTDGRTVVGTYCGRIRSFLAEVFGSRRTPPGRLPNPSAPHPGAPPPGGRQAPEAAPRPEAEALPPAEDSRQGTAPGRGTSPAGDGAAPTPGTPAPPGRSRRNQPAARRPGLNPESLDHALGLLAGLKDRLERIEAQIGPDKLRELVRDAAGSAASGPGLLERLLPAVLVALGWTGPPAVAAVVGLRIVAGLIRRRAGKRAKGAGSAASAPGALNDDYAAQLAQVFALSGRSVLADATLGREYDQELRQAEQSSDAALATWARGLREKVARRFFRIHGQSPAPAEPSS